MVSDLDYVSKKDYCKIKKKNNICIDVFSRGDDLTYPVDVSNQKFENCIDLLLITDENKSHYVYKKDFNRFMINKTKTKNKNFFSECCLQSFSSEKVLIEHKGNCLIINAKQGIKLKGGSI